MNEVPLERIQRMECAVGQMKKDLAAPIALSDLARSVPFSRFHFLRIFRDVTGLTPGRFLAVLRMAEARRLLLHSSLAVSAISLQVGYTSVGTFTTQFTRLIGLSPEQFRKVVRARRGMRRTGPGQAGTPGPGPVICPASWSTGDLLVVAWRPASGSTSAESCLVAEPGPVAVPLPHDGRSYQVRILQVAAAAPVTHALVDDRPGSYLYGTVDRPLTAGTRTAEPLPVALRRPRPTDPPLLPATPLIQMNQWSGNLERSA